MKAPPVVSELFEALRQAYPGDIPEPDASPVRIPVASVLQHADSNGQTEQHNYDSLRAALSQRRNGTLRKLARELGFKDKDAGALSDLLHGRYDHVSLETANRWAHALGLPPIPIMKRAEVCPSCLRTKGELVIHDAGDCHNRPIASVVTLAPDEAVVKRNGHAPQRERKRYHSRPCLSLDPAERIAQCERIIEEARKALIETAPTNVQARVLLAEWQREPDAEFDASSIERLQLRDGADA